MSSDQHLHQASEEWIDTIKSQKGYQAIDAERYRKFLRRMKNYVFYRRLRAYTLKTDTVLEAGCGWALASFALAEEGIRVTAIDISPELITDLQRLQTELGGNFQSHLACTVGDIFRLPELGKTVNVICSDGTYEHFLERSDRMNIFKNFRDILTENGKVALAVPNIHNPFFGTAVDQKMPAMRPFTLSELRQELEEGGFKILEDGYTFVNPGFEQWISARWLIPPVKALNVVFPYLPRFLKKVCAAHIFVFAEKL